MLLTIKDLVATVLAILTGVFAYLVVQGFQFPLITGYRSATLVLLLMGVAMCAMGSATNYANPIVLTMAVLGGLLVVLMIASFILGTKMLFLGVAGTIIILWVMATVRHLMGL